HIALHVVPMAPDGANVELAMVCVQDVSEVMDLRRRGAEIEKERSRLADELGATSGRLTELNKDLQGANELLQTTNEEMMLAHEELQATNEEFEATNEDLQATNEELETNNEELQA